MIERMHYYVTKLLGSGPSYNIALQTDNDAPFRAYGLAFYVFDGSGNPLAAAGNVNFKLRFTKPDGTAYFQRNLVNAQALNPFDHQATNGAGGLAAPYFSYTSALHPNFLYPPQSTITWDFSDVPSVATARIYAILVGTKLYRPDQVWSPTYPAKYRALPFNGFSIQVPTANLPQLNIPVPSVSIGQLNADADFVWQCGAQTDHPAALPDFPGGLHGLGIKIRDWVGKSYMNDYVPVELLFGFDNAQRPGLVYPEIYIPKNQQIFVDVAAL